MFCYRNVCPPVPWGYADLIRQGIQSVDGSSLIATCDDQCIVDTRKRICNTLNDVILPGACNTFYIQLAISDQFIYCGMLADDTGYNKMLSLKSICRLWCYPGNERYVFSDVFNVSNPVLYRTQQRNLPTLMGSRPTRP
jgi:hypothetical protein